MQRLRMKYPPTPRQYELRSHNGDFDTPEQAILNGIQFLEAQDVVGGDIHDGLIFAAKALREYQKLLPSDQWLVIEHTED